MKRDSNPLWPASVLVEKVKFSKVDDLGIDFINEIDAWSKMEFNSRQQIKQLRQKRLITADQLQKNLNPLVYSIREKID